MAPEAGRRRGLMRGTFSGPLAAGLLPFAAGAVTIDLAPVGDPDNAPDPPNTNSVPGIGSVPCTHQIGKFEVRNSEFADFVAATDACGLYSSSMNSGRPRRDRPAGLGRQLRVFGEVRLREHAVLLRVVRRRGAVR